MVSATVLQAIASVNDVLNSNAEYIPYLLPSHLYADPSKKSGWVSGSIQSGVLQVLLQSGGPQDAVRNIIKDWAIGQGHMASPMELFIKLVTGGKLRIEGMQLREDLTEKILVSWLLFGIFMYHNGTINVLQDPGLQSLMLNRVSRILRGVPTRKLDFGHGVQYVPALLTMLQRVCWARFTSTIPKLSFVSVGYL